MNATDSASKRVTIISSDCHAGGLPGMYDEYMPKEFHEASTQWWLTYVKEMIARTGTFFDQEAVEDYTAMAGGDAGGLELFTNPQRLAGASDEELLAVLSDETSPFSPRRGEFDAAVRLKELEEDGIAGEVIFPQMAPFGAGLMQYRHDVKPEQNQAGIRAYNRWLADLCQVNPGRHAGVMLINVDDIEATVQEIKEARALGLFGGVLLPTSTGEHPFYHHPRYEPIWQICEDLELPLQSHSGWSPDYGDLPSATAMYISEVDMWAQRPFTALLWAGVFERYPKLAYVLTETGTAWIVEKLRVLEFKADNPLFAHFTKELSLRPTEYFQRQCYIGASFMPAHEGKMRYEVGVDKLMWGSDYPHIEGTWPNTMASLQDTFSDYPEDEIRSILGAKAAEVYNFDVDKVNQMGERIGPTLGEIRGIEKRSPSLPPE